MTTPGKKPVTCRLCRTGTMQPIERERVFHPPGKTVVVKTLAAACDHCTHEAVLASQHGENLQRLAARAAEYDGRLLGENIFALRRRHALEQSAVARMFGKSTLSFSRYENEHSFPDASTTKLLQLAIELPAVVPWLAREAGVSLPFGGPEGRPRHEGPLPGKAILELRRRYLLDQASAARMFGRSTIAFSRYENGHHVPTASTAKLLRMAIDLPEVVTWLARQSGTCITLMLPASAPATPTPSLESA